MALLLTRRATPSLLRTCTLLRARTASSTSEQPNFRRTAAPHFKDTAPLPSASVQESKEITGDWVLFHPVYTPEEVRSVKVIHRKAGHISDYIARGLVKTSRATFDLVTGYKEVDVDKAIAERTAAGKAVTVTALRE